jgi:hypothetical protein
VKTHFIVRRGTLARADGSFIFPRRDRRRRFEYELEMGNEMRLKWRRGKVYEGWSRGRNTPLVAMPASEIGVELDAATSDMDQRHENQSTMEDD